MASTIGLRELLHSAITSPGEFVIRRGRGVHRTRTRALRVENLEERHVLAPTLLPGDMAIASAAENQIAPSIARGNDQMLVVWSDNRAKITGNYESETSSDIYGIRLDASGVRIDSMPLALVARKAAQGNPKVAWNGSNWLVVYESYDLSGTGYYYEKSLEAVRVDPTGRVLDDGPIKLFGLTPPTAGYWDVASDGNNWVVVNQGTSTSQDIVGVRISPTGQLLDPPTRTLVNGTYYLRSNFHVEYAGGTFLLTFNDLYVDGLYTTSAVKFDRTLGVQGPLMTNYLPTPLADLASNGQDFYGVWTQQLPDFSFALKGTRINTSGVKVDGAGVVISSGDPTPTYAATSVVWDGVQWKVTWGDFDVTRLARINPAGQVLDPNGVGVVGLTAGPSAGTGTGGVQLVWTEYANNYDVFTGNVSSSNQAGSGIPLSIGAMRQLRPDIANSGNGSMVVYTSGSSSTQRILVQPLNAAGDPLTVEPIVLDTLSSSVVDSPSVAWNGSVYMVVWSKGQSLVAQRLASNGTLVDPSPVVVMSNASGPPRIAALSGDFLVTGRRFVTPQIIVAVASRVRGSDGTVLDAQPRVLGGTYLRSAPEVVPLGNRWFVAWHSNFSHDDPMAATQGIFFSPDGTTTSAFSIHGIFSTAGGNGSFALALASDGNQAIMVQSQELTSGVETDLLARFIQSDGTVSPMINLTPWVGNQFKPQATWDGHNFVVAYHEQRNRVAPWTLDQLDSRADLYAMRISPNRTIVDPQGFVLSARETGEADPNLSAAQGVTQVVWSQVLNDATFANYRVVRDKLGDGTNQWPVVVVNSDRALGDVPMAVNFNSLGSIDPDGTLATYQWTFGDGSTSTAPNPSHTFVTPGEYLVTLTVTDNLGAATTQAIRVVAQLPNQLPVAVATADYLYGTAPLDVTFSAEESYDPDGFLGNMEWYFEDGSYTYGSFAYQTYTSNGVYPVTLKVYDSRGAVGTTTVMIYVGVTPPGDFDGNGTLDAADVDALSAEIVRGTHQALYDVTGDSLVNLDDLSEWILDLKRTKFGDANLDFAVDGTDFNIWNSQRFTMNTAWSAGNFNADSVVDGSDFNIWNQNKFSFAISSQGTVPLGSQGWSTTLRKKRP